MDNNNSVSISSDVYETIIGQKTVFKGNVNTDKPIKIEGVFEGTIESLGSVFIADTGRFDGILHCRNLELVGTLTGKVKCSDTFRFALSGKFQGEATTANIDIRPGSSFDGTLKIEK